MSRFYISQSGRTLNRRQFFGYAGAEGIFNFVLLGGGENFTKEKIIRMACEEDLREYAREPYCDEYCKEETIEKYNKECKKALDFCIKKFPEIPEEEWLKAYKYYLIRECYHDEDDVHEGLK